MCLQTEACGGPITAVYDHDVNEFARRAGIYFGIVEPTPEELAREPGPPPSLLRHAFALIVLVGLAYFFGGGTLGGTLRYLVFCVLVLGGTRLLYWWQERDQPEHKPRQ